MTEPIYSIRYIKRGNGRQPDRTPTNLPVFTNRILGRGKRDRWKYIVAAKAIEISERNYYGVDIYEDKSTLMINFFLDLPCILTELGGILGLANTITISRKKHSHSLMLSTFYDMDML